MMHIDRREALGSGFATMTAFAAPGVSARVAPTGTTALPSIRPLRVKGLTIGEGRPKLIVSIAEATAAAAFARARALAATSQVDVVEYRIDHLADHGDPDRVAASVAEIAGVCAAKPLLMTFRTKAEGGMAAIAPDAYAALYDAALDRGGPDLIDLEHALCSDASVAAVLRRAQAAHLPVILSYHDFHATPSIEAMVDKLRAMQALGADIPKIAVMPRDGDDTLRLLQATWEMHSRYADRPLLTMAMGGVGAISRVGGETFGSALTFGAVGAASAPGQLPAPELRAALDMLSDGQGGNSRMTPAIRRPTFLNTILLGGPAEGKIAAAAAAGFDQIELWTNDVAGFAGGAPAVKSFLADRRLGLTDYQVLLDFDGAPGDKRVAKRAEAIHMLDTAVAVGASTLLAPASTDPDCDRTRIAEDLAWLVDQARARGLRIAYEGMAWSTVNSGVPRSWAAVRDLDPRHAGIVVDAYHLFVTGGTVADLAGVDPQRIFLVQLSDVARPVVPADYKQVARHARLLPGQGRFPLASLIETLDRMGYEGPIGLEVFNDDLKARDPEIAADMAYQALADTLEGASDRRGRLADDVRRSGKYLMPR